MFIQGKSGFFVDVTKRGLIFSKSIGQSHQEFINAESGEVWGLDINAIDPVGADDIFFYLENTGNLPIRIHRTRFSSTVAGFVTIKKVSGTPSFTSGTDVTPLSFNTSETPKLNATVKTDTDTTGLTSEGVWERISLATANVGVETEIESSIMVTPGDALALEWSAATGIISGTIVAYRVDE